MNWYLAQLVFQIRCGEGFHTPQFDEQLRLILAASEKEAVEKATEHGLREQSCFPNDRNQPVRWEFVAVSALHGLGEPVDGAEICSRIQEVEDDESYRSFVRRKAELLLQSLPLTYSA